MYEAEGQKLAVLCRVVREGLTENVVFEQIFKERESKP